WEAFIDSLLREWKTLNIVSVFVLSTPITLITVLLLFFSVSHCPMSLICSLMNFLYGCMYIIHF
ncbi:hypothetical protein L208DRAFT_1215546, partial [Tricholoma matsutake]